MTEERKQHLLQEAVSYLSGISCDEKDLYSKLRLGLHLTNAELLELGCADLEPHFEPDTPEMLREAEASSYPRLSTLLSARWEDVHLIHDKIENDPCTIVELSEKTLTDAGKKAWADVLDARVKRIYTGFYGLQLELSGVKAGRLDKFSAMLAGYCPAEDYDKWVAPEDPGQAQTLLN